MVSEKNCSLLSLMFYQCTIHVQNFLYQFGGFCFYIIAFELITILDMRLCAFFFFRENKMVDVLQSYSPKLGHMTFKKFETLLTALLNKLVCSLTKIISILWMRFINARLIFWNFFNVRDFAFSLSQLNW